jgi:hypothetical protein
MPGPPPPSTFNLPTFTVAAIGAATGLFSVGWNAVPYVSSGAKLRVKIHYVLHVPQGPVFEVHAYNKRRGPVEIRNWGVSYSRPSEASSTVMLAGSALAEHYDGVPTTIDGGHSATWGVLARELVAFEMNEKHPVTVRGVVELATGKERTSAPLKLQAGSLHQTLRAEDDDYVAPAARRLRWPKLASFQFRPRKSRAH